MVSSSDYESIVVPHYERREVQEEIAKFSRGRWVALHCETRDARGRPYLLRYRRARNVKVPLTINTPEDVSAHLERFEGLRPRTFYASANVYKEIAIPEHVRVMDNIAFCLPTWDIDNVIEKWEATMAAAREIVDFLSDEGVSRSVFLNWSGNGAHVHIHHKAFSAEFLQKINPLDAAYAVVEYVNGNLRARYREIAEKHEARKLSIENEMDLQRVFTCPLSLHRSLNLAAVCFSPDMINDFAPDWASIGRYRHWKGWDRFETGEADRLAEKAYQTVGAYSLRKIPGPPKRREGQRLNWSRNG
ncbi:MAG: hypothetical protein ACE5OW_04845 [Candidatus Bathyarchaeia archaeon]